MDILDGKQYDMYNTARHLAIHHGKTSSTTKIHVPLKEMKYG
jgi:hypothetical protein